MSIPSSENSEWSGDIEKVLDSIRINCSILNDQHKIQYFYYKAFLKYFKVPVLVLSGINSVASIGLSQYIKQKDVSLTCCLISLITGIITSLELYLSIEKSMENELNCSKDFYLLSIDVYKTLQLKRENRSVDGNVYLESCLSQYKKLFESSNVLTKKIKDQLIQIDIENMVSDSKELDIQLYGGNVNNV